ncbi:MAG: hypothetical protein NT150_05910 [Bacteroidetes bacterium]|nr:hypothetical protein [Bacteroidota bacterium]
MNIRNPTLLLLFIFLICSLSSCWLPKFARGVQEDSLRISRINRSTFYSSGLIGIVKKKEIKNPTSKHYISIDFIDRDEALDGINRDIFCLPYYEIHNNTLDVLVSKELFKQISVSDTVLKKIDSRFLTVKGSELPFLNPNQEIWLP